MKKITKFLIAIAFLMTAISVNAQQNCGVICHNGTLLTGVGQQAVDGHIIHGDTFITNDCNYVEIGNECESLSVPKFDINSNFPLGLYYTIHDIKGSLLAEGLTFRDMKRNLPKKELLFLKVHASDDYPNGFKVTKLIAQ